MGGRELLKDGFLLAVFLVAVFITASVGALLTAPSVPGWYNTLEKPSWTPPNHLFGPVWTILYIFIAVAGWLAWKKTGPGIDYLTFGLYLLQLVLNALWSGFFFALQNPGLAFLEIVLLWLVILGTLIRFTSLSRTAALLFVPYLVWVTYALALNFAIWRLNS